MDFPKIGVRIVEVRDPDPAYAKMTDDQLINCQNILEQGMDRIEELERDWTPDEEMMHRAYQRDFHDIEREQSSRWRDLMDPEGS